MRSLCTGPLHLTGHDVLNQPGHVLKAHGPRLRVYLLSRASGSWGGRMFSDRINTFWLTASSDTASMISCQLLPNPQYT